MARLRSELQFELCVGSLRATLELVGRISIGMADNEAQLQGVLGMLRGLDEMIGGTDSWTAAELRKISSKLKAISVTVEQKVAAVKEAPKQSMNYDALVKTITEMIR